MLYPQLKYFQNVEERSGDDEYEDELHEVNDDDDEEYLNRRRYLDFQDEKNKNWELTSTVTSKSPSSSSQLSSMMTNELHFATQPHEGVTRHLFSNNTEEESFHSFVDSSLFNSTDRNLNEAYDFHSTSTRKLLPSQTFSLPKYERVYDSIFESHSRRLYSYMLRDMDTIQELQQFLMLQQLLMNSSFISKELREDQIMLGNIDDVNSLFQSGAGEMVNLDNNGTKLTLNFSAINMSACYAVMKKLEQSIEQKKRKMNILSEERERIMKLRKAKLHSKKKNQRLAFLRQNYTVAQLCVYHRFLDESSCVDALSVPIVIKKCPSGAVYWLEKIIQQCPSGACVKSEAHLL